MHAKEDYHTAFEVLPIIFLAIALISLLASSIYFYTEHFHYCDSILPQSNWWQKMKPAQSENAAHTIDSQPIYYFASYAGTTVTFGNQSKTNRWVKIVLCSPNQIRDVQVFTNTITSTDSAQPSFSVETSQNPKTTLTVTAGPTGPRDKNRLWNVYLPTNIVGPILLQAIGADNTRYQVIIDSAQIPDPYGILNH